MRPFVNARLRMDQEAIDAVIVRRLPLLVPLPDSISWRQVAAADRAVGDWEILEIQEGRTPYDFLSRAGKSWAELVSHFIQREI